MRRQWKLVAAAALSAVVGGVTPTAGAVEVPGSCTPSGGRIVTPGCVPAATGEVREIVDPGTSLPNLVPAITFAEIGYYYSLDENGEVVPSPPNVRFSVAVRNEGAYPMDLLGDPSTDLTSTTAQQCVAWTERVCRRREQVGGFAWHAEHNHFHFQEFATYELRRLDADGHVDPSPEALLQTAPKVSFCLMDTEATRSDAPPPFYVQCLGVSQGISPGWQDVYSNVLPGQGLSVEGLPDGRYGLVVRLDPNNRLYETNETDNETAVIVEIFDGGTQARIVGPGT